MRPTASAARGIGASVRVSLYLGCPGRELAEGTPRHRIDLGHGQDSAEPRPIHNLDQLPGDPFRGRMRRRAQPRIRRRSCRRISRPYRSRNEIVGTTNRSIAAMPSAWLRRKVLQRRWASPPGHVLGHARLPDIDAKVEKFAMNSRYFQTTIKTRSVLSLSETQTRTYW